MEFKETPASAKNSKHFPLTPFRIIRGVICLSVLLSTAFVFLIYFVPVAAVLLRFFSTLYSRKAVAVLFGLWLGLWPFLFEKVNETNVVFSGDHVPPRERVLLIANHRTEVDWMYVWNLAFRKGCLGHIKYLLKKSLMKLPVFGWGFYVLEFIPLERDWIVDEPVIKQSLSTFTNPQDPLWLTVFPEGTDYSDEKCKTSQEFARRNGLPVLNNVLLPKTKGFYACLEILRSSLDAVYDVTIAYKNQCPTFLDNAFGVDPSEVHIHVRRIPLEKIPDSEKEVSKWLMETFAFKDKLLFDFIANGHFPNEGTEGELSTAKCLANLVIVMAITEAIAVSATQFTLQNNCGYTVWPGTLSGNGVPISGDSGFALTPGATIQLSAPGGFSGRFWGRTGCNFDESGTGKCITGDCGALKCPSGAGGVPPVSLVEFTLGKSKDEKDFYDVSLVDGYNVGIGVRSTGGSGDCQYAGCVADLNANCPKELQVIDSGVVVACKSACAQFNTPEYCCTGDHATPATCSPTEYSKLFKNACPSAYSYAYDDASSTCTCSAADYIITFCPTTS